MTESSVDLTNLVPVKLRWDQVLLDPNNPRLAGISEGSVVPDEAIGEPELQEMLMSRLREVGFTDITDKIKKLGFLTIDRIVVRPINVAGDKYVVLEGNRRIAALRSLRGNPVVMSTLDDFVRASLEEIEALCYQGSDADIAWFIQGVRHIDSIKEWGPYQQARFLVDLKERRDIPLKKLGEIAGLSGARVSRLVRSYYGWSQASKDSDYGDVVDEKDFSIFLEAVFHKAASEIAAWLDWDEATHEFKKSDRLSLLLSLLKPNDGAPARIARVNPDLRDKFARLVLSDHQVVLSEFVNGTRSLDEAYASVQSEDSTKVLLNLDAQWARLTELKERLETLPLPKIVTSIEKDEFVSLLLAISTSAHQQASFLNKGPDQQ